MGMIPYTLINYERLLLSLLEHLELVAVTLLLSVPLAMLVSLITDKSRVLHHTIYGVLLIIYCVPSIALFSLLIPLTGLGKGTAIIGCDDIFLSRMLEHPLSAVKRNIYQMGVRGVELLVEAMGQETPKFREEILPVSLVLRATT